MAGVKQRGRLHISQVMTTVCDGFNTTDRLRLIGKKKDRICMKIKIFEHHSEEDKKKSS